MVNGYDNAAAAFSHRRRSRDERRNQGAGAEDGDKGMRDDAVLWGQYNERYRYKTHRVYTLLTQDEIIATRIKR